MAKYIHTIVSFLILLSLSNYAIAADNNFTVDGNKYVVTSRSSLRIVGMSVPKNGKVVIPYEVTYNTKTMDVNEIGNNENFFDEPEKVISLTIPASISAIQNFKSNGHTHNHSFEKCVNLKTIVFEDSWQTLFIPSNRYDETIYYSCFYNCPLEELYIGRNLSHDGWYCAPFHYKKSLKNVVIGKCVYKIEDCLFEGCKNIEKIDLPNVENIGGCAFLDCEKLKQVNLYNSLKVIGGQSFKRTAIKTIDLPSSLETIGSEAMYGCKSLESITIPDKVKEIPSWAFYDCSKLTQLTIGKSVTKILKGAFYSTDLRKIYSRISSPSKCTLNSAFSSGTYANAILYVPEGTIELYRNSKEWELFFNIQEGSITEIHGVMDDERDNSDNKLYNLHGIKIKTPKGLYIKNGKKYIHRK